eukprot:TRINITY_DN27922_c0_g1_i1.p1 TRINITY_DN27922_c0_g1~~TRINITY_DN27922_c0_g1_i1.p1  ORF type:complete len:379 (+),score=58.80 TRINITY_DN27922_c0_g1_i1:12-1148(+)
MRANTNGEGSNWVSQTHLTFPPFSVECRDNRVFVGGGGGAGNTGIPNQLIQYETNNQGLFRTIFNQDTEKKPVLSLKIHPSENLLACCVGKFCRIYSFTDEGTTLVKEWQTVFSEHRDAEQKVAVFSPNGKYLITGGTDGIQLYLTHNFVKISDLSIHKFSIKDIEWNYESSHIVVLGMKEGSLVKLSHSPKGSTVFEFKVPSEHHDFKKIRFSPSGVFFTSQNLGTRQASITKWGSYTKRMILSKTVYRGFHHTAFDISADGAFLGLGSVKGDVTVLSSNNLDILMSVLVHSFCISDIAFAFVNQRDRRNLVDRRAPSATTPTPSNQKSVVMSVGFDSLVVSTPVTKRSSKVKRFLLLATFLIIVILASLYLLLLAN